MGLLNVKGDMQELLGLRLFVLGDGRIRDRFESLAGIWGMQDWVLF